MSTEAVAAGRAAVLVAAHNERLTIAATLESVLEAYAPDDVFLFDDASDDGTADIAERYLPARNVIRHAANVGKSRGLEYALTRDVYPSGYEFVTILDADTTMEPRYRERALAALADDRVACAAGQVKSRPDGANLVSIYRACLYFFWQALFKRLQSVFDAVAIAPGCASTWRVSALRQIRFDHRLSTEDFHLSIATHRQRLGRIRYVAGAVVWTQDPRGLRAFVRQTYRWNRAWWEVVRIDRVGLCWLRRDPVGRLRPSGLDIVNAVVIVLMATFFLRLFAIPVLLVLPHEPPQFAYPGGRDALALHLAIQLAFLLAVVLIGAIATGRFAMVVLAPFVVALMLLEFANSVRALASVLHHAFPRRPSGGDGEHLSSAWESPARRRVVPAAAHEPPERARAGGPLRADAA